MISRLLFLAFAVALAVFGGFCLNYTKPSALEHHREWAAAHGAPPPSDAILAGGVGCVVAGMVLIGLGLRRRRR